jgi:hypothetical protein
MYDQNYISGYPNAWSHNMVVQNQFHNSDDIESDVMDEESDDTNSGSDDEDDSNSEDPEDDTKQLEEEENYIRFVQSVFCDDDLISTASFTDEEDEEYNPDDKEDEDDDDFDGNDRDKVKNKELQGLVSECWQTIVGEAPVLPNGVGDDDDDDASFSCDMDLTTTGLDFDPATEGATITNKALNLSNSVAQSLHSPTKKRRDSSIEGVLSPHKAPLFPSEAAAASSTSDARSNASITSSPSKSAKLSNCGSNKGRTPAASQSVLSSIVSQLFAGDTPSEVCVEGMPVDAIRKLVARQMSMATQLLVQILLQADEKSECFTTAYTSLMELSNLRDTALKKAKLIEMNMQNVNSIRHSHAREQQQQQEQSSQQSQPSEGDECEEDRVAVVERRVTRSGVGTAMSARSSSVFDIPALTHVQGLFDAIDASRKAVKLQLSQSGAQPKAPSVTFSDDLTGTGHLLLALGGRQASAGQSSSSTESASSAITPSDAASRARLLSLSSVQTAKIMKASGMRAWSCLAPLSHYPLHEALMLRTDPSSLTGRSMFTPAEDDLLLRGIITMGESAWSRIKAVFLPSKEAQLLQFRFTQMTNLAAAPDSNNFKRYVTIFSHLRRKRVGHCLLPGTRSWRWSTARETPSGATRRTWIC